jgi:hypothetical protein
MGGKKSIWIHYLGNRCKQSLDKTGLSVKIRPFKQGRISGLELIVNGRIPGGTILDNYAGEPVRLVDEGASIGVYTRRLDLFTLLDKMIQGENAALQPSAPITRLRRRGAA